MLLTEVGRTLEEGIPLRKTQWRLSRNLQRPELARTVLENLLELSPDFADGHYYLGVIASKEEDWEAAAVRFLRAVELGPDSGRAQRDLGLALEKLGRRDDAALHLAIAASLGAAADGKR